MNPTPPSRSSRRARDLLTLGVFAAVSVRLGGAPDTLGRVPVTFQVGERPRHVVSLNAGYSSDLGGSGGVTWVIGTCAATPSSSICPPP